MWDLVYSSASDLVRSRFEATGYQVNFKEDDKQIWGPGWVISEMEFSADGLLIFLAQTKNKAKHLVH